MPADERDGVDVSALRRRIAADQAAGATPWLLVGAAGDTDAGRVDPLNELADIAAETGAWLHVDAAYGGFFALTERGARRLRGVERADSISIDAHKSLFLPYGTGGLLVRHRGVLAKAHSAEGAYLRDVHEIDSLPHYFNRGPENTRPFRGLLAWLPLHLHRVAAFRDMLDQKLDLTADITIRLGGIPRHRSDRGPAAFHRPVSLHRRRRRHPTDSPAPQQLRQTARLEYYHRRLAGSTHSAQ